MSTLEIAAAERALGLLPGHELPAVCEQALGEGIDSRSLAMLAGITPAAYNAFEVDDLWAAALRELGITTPSKEEAARIVIRNAAERVLRGGLTPRAALWRVQGAYYASGAYERDTSVAGDSLDLGPLAGLYYEYDELGEPWSRTEEELDRDVLDAFRVFAETGAA